jgi:GNAT superfamily N-acetyltransferase
MDIAVTPLDPADETAAGQAYEINAAQHAADVPDLPICRVSFLGGLVHPWPGNRVERFVAYLGDAPAGYLQVDLPTLDNTENAELDLVVHPDYRRRGVGRALYERAVAVARENGRKRLMTMTVETLPGGAERDGAGSAFARAIGAKSALTEVRRRLRVSTVDDAALDTQLAEAWQHAKGYSVVQWGDETPEEDLDDIAYLDGRLLSDAPMGDLTWEPQKVDAARVRACEAARKTRQRRDYNTAVRHDESGRIVAWTTLEFSRSIPDHCFQQITIVDPVHRGHRLGTIVKIENLRYARAHEPAVQNIDTWNAAVNDHMISINEAIGFRPLDGWANWQQDV